MTDAQTEARAMPDLPDDDSDFTPDLARKIIELYQAALAAKDAELAKIDAHRRKVVAENERLLNALIDRDRQLAEARKALANYDRWLNGRDAYIVQKGLWQNFVASLPGSPTARRALEEQGGEDG